MHRYKSITVLVIIIILLGSIGQAPVTANPASTILNVAATGGVRLVSTAADGLVLEMDIPAYSLQSRQAVSGTCDFINLPGWDISGTSGEPALPMRGVLVALPPGALPSFTIETTEPEVVQVGVNLCPASTLAQEPLSANDSVSIPINNRSTAEVLTSDATAYSQDVNFPGALVEADTPVMLRSQRVATLRLQPFQYNPITQRLTVVRRLVVHLNFAPNSQRLPPVDEGPYEAVLRGALLNYDQGSAWRTSPAQVNLPPELPSPALKITISTDGLFILPYVNLHAAGLPEGIIRRSLRLVENGIEVALYAPGDPDIIFTSGDELYFYGQKNSSRFSDLRAYWLTWGGPDGLRMDEIDGSPVDDTPVLPSYRYTQHTETNKYYLSNFPSGSDMDRWYWTYIFANNGPTSQIFTIPLVKVSTTATDQAVLRGVLKGYAAAPMHHTRIFINNHLVLDETWPAQGELDFNVPILQDFLVEGVNAVLISAPRDNGITLDFSLVNWLEIDYSREYFADSSGSLADFGSDSAGLRKYNLAGFTTGTPLVFNITDPIQPQLIQNAAFSIDTLTFQQDLPTAGRFLAVTPVGLLSPDDISAPEPDDLLSSTNGADYIIISHPDFLDAIRPLADHYVDRGLRVKVVNVQDVYDLFSGGNFDPVAIRDFLAYTYAAWTPPAPTYVLLVGDGNYDFKNFSGINEPIFIPPWLAEVDAQLGETAADNRYVAFGSDGLLPQMALGRLPVKSVAEAYAVVAKILTYAQAVSGDWTKTVGFIADKADSAGDFPAASDVTAAMLPSNYQVEKVYYGVTHPDLTAAHQAVLDEFNQGHLIIHYSGHATPFQWANDVLLYTSDVTSLDNAGHLPFVVSMTCSVGYFIFPSMPALGEVLLIEPQNGAVATWSPAGLGVQSGHDVLDQGLFRAFFQLHLAPVGLATTSAKLYLYSSTDLHRDLIDTYLLFGDPAMSLQLSQLTYLPTINR